MATRRKKARAPRTRVGIEAGDVSVGIDIGGTFTDVVCAGPAGMRTFKVASTRANPSRAVVAALELLSAEHGIAAASIGRFVHGTTVATNAVIERKGARVGLITTQGFRDVLELGRQMRRQMYDLRLKPETPVWLAPGARRVEVSERIAADGSVLRPLDPQSLELAVARLLEQKVEAIAVSLLFAFVNPVHERAVKAYLDRHCPGLPVSLSSEVDPAFREYERTVVTGFDAYIKPIVDRYLSEMEADLARMHVPAPLQVMQSRGGLAGASVARQRPVRLFLSGPAAGAIGGAAAGAAAGLKDVITIDVGGTSSDIALIDGGRPLVKADAEIAGYAVRVPMLDVTTLGAGGGSIAWIDAGGGLRVGPHSAGAEPGPACYARGGGDATVTDASILLGYLDPAYFAGGTMRLDAGLARAVIAEKVAGPLGMSVEEAALGIHRIVNARMADGIRLVSLNRGYDPREFALVPLGGAGGLHAAALADELDMRRVLIPRFPGVLSAAGLLSAPIEHEVSAALHAPLADLALGDVQATLRELDAHAEQLMQSERTVNLVHERAYYADVGYAGQSHFLSVPLDASRKDALSRLYHDFEAAHERLNGHATHAPAKLVNLRAVHRALLPPLAEAAATGPAAPGKSLKGRREVVFAGERSAMRVAVHDRAQMAAGETIKGPAVIEQDDSTTLVPPGWRVRVEAGAQLMMERT
jgi:N-methylhydantoinase A/oxoprolinase/acetone carboxylase beta subunit